MDYCLAVRGGGARARDTSLRPANLNQNLRAFRFCIACVGIVVIALAASSTSGAAVMSSLLSSPAAASAAGGTSFSSPASMLRLLPSRGAGCRNRNIRLKLRLLPRRNCRSGPCGADAEIAAGKAGTAGSTAEISAACTYARVQSRFRQTAFGRRRQRRIAPNCTATSLHKQGENIWSHPFPRQRDSTEAGSMSPVLDRRFFRFSTLRPVYPNSCSSQ
jgi:hypothetical protein